MGTTALILGIVGICLSWIPVVGWFGVALGVAAWGLGIPSVVKWYERPGYTGWGAASIVLGLAGVSLGFAFQVKHADGGLSGWIVRLPVDAVLAGGACVLAGVIACLVVARGKVGLRAPLGVACFCGLLVSSFVFGSTLYLEDQKMASVEARVGAERTDGRPVTRPREAAGAAD
jgi:hypothetical protein